MTMPAKTKIWLSMGILLLFVVAVAVIALWSVQTVNGRLEAMLADNLRGAGLSARLAESAHRMSGAINALALQRDAKEIEREERRLLEAQRRYDKWWAEMKRSPVSGDETLVREKVRMASRQVREVNRAVLGLVTQGQFIEARKMILQEENPLLLHLDAAIAEYRDLQERFNKSLMDEAQTLYHRSIAIMIVLSVVATLFAAVAALHIRNGLSREPQS